MEKTEEKITKETKDNEIVELKDEDMSTITAGSETHNNGHVGSKTGYQLAKVTLLET
ncbi:MAG: hypothetical protein MJ250_08525 [Alphaproteobacteria bacterium]|nr:hypothetical protein [Alphaproteobacteria bacterium]